jgi:hypothetical protein
MATVAEILARIDEKAPFSMVVEASVRDYCVLALKFLRGQADYSRYFESVLPNPLPVLEKEASARKHAGERYCVQLYAPSEEALLADAIADLAFAQSQRLTLATPATPQADDRERACVYITAVYTLFALSLHGRTDFAVLFLEAWANFNAYASARTVRKHYDRSWNSRYESLFYPLG